MKIDKITPLGAIDVPKQLFSENDHAAKDSYEHIVRKIFFCGVSISAKNF
jgi:hypothetical protein